MQNDDDTRLGIYTMHNIILLVLVDHWILMEYSYSVSALRKKILCNYFHFVRSIVCGFCEILRIFDFSSTVFTPGHAERVEL